MPISYTQDVIGPIGRCVTDVATALTVMAGIGFDPLDNAVCSRPNILPPLFPPWGSAPLTCRRLLSFLLVSETRCTLRVLLLAH